MIWWLGICTSTVAGAGLVPGCTCDTKTKLLKFLKRRMWQNMWDRSLDKKVRMYQLVWIRRMPMTRKQCWKPEHQHVYNVSSERWSYYSYLYPRIFVTYLQQTLLCFTFADTAPHMWKARLSILLSVSFSIQLPTLL